MPLITIPNTNRQHVPATGHTHPATNVTRGHGRRSVVYRATTGRTFEAIVIGPGSSSGLRLMIPALRMKGPSVYIKDNIGPATTVKSTNCYIDRWGAKSPVATS